MTIITYKSKGDLEKALKQLGKTDPALRAAHKNFGTPPMRRRPTGFEGLTRLLISQQLSTAAAGTIQTRFNALIGEISPENYLSLDESAIAACGISGPKRRYMRALAETILGGEINFTALHRKSDAEIYERLTSLLGIGAWSAECYLLFCLRRADIFPSGDLALQEGYKILYNKRVRPSAAALEKAAEVWRPHRGAAARMLWVFYNGTKAQEKSLRNSSESGKKK